MKASTNTNASINAIVATFVVAYKAKQEAVTALRAALKVSGITLDRATLTQPLMQSVAMAYGVTMVVKTRGEGVTWNMDDKGSIAAKRCYATLMADLFRGEAAHTDTLDVPADIQAMAAKLWAMCGAYEGAGKLLATAIANAKVK